MDFGALPPEINSGLMYSGPGSGSMLAAASGWDGLAAELRQAASSYGAVISGLTDGPWRGVASASMAAAAAPYVAWLSTTAAQAEQAAAQATAAANAYHSAFAMTVPPPVIAANRAQLAALLATNFFGQNAPAIAANEALYSEMWAQDAAAMNSYAANSAAASNLTSFTSPPQTTNPAGEAQQAAAVNHALGTSASQQTSSTVTQAQSLAETSSTVINPTTGEPVATGGSFDLSSLFTPTTLATLLPGYVMMANTPIFAIGGLMGIGEQLTQWAMRSNEAAAEAEAAAADAWDAGADAAAWDAGADSGAWMGMGEAASVGGLSVPESWGWTAAALDALPAGAPFAIPTLDGLALASADLGAAGAPMLMGGLPLAAGSGGTAGAGAAAVKYGLRPTVMARPPAAGFAADPTASGVAAAPVHAGYTTHGNPPPGYRAAIVYVPTPEHAPAAT